MVSSTLKDALGLENRQASLLRLRNRYFFYLAPRTCIQTFVKKTLFIYYDVVWQCTELKIGCSQDILGLSQTGKRVRISILEIPVCFTINHVGLLKKCFHILKYDRLKMLTTCSRLGRFEHCINICYNS